MSGKLSKSPFEFLVIVVLFFLPVWVYLHNYIIGDCDDKAVHYYSAAMFSADPAKKQTVLHAVPELIRNEAPEQKERVVNRILSYYNYPAANVIINTVHGVMGPGHYAKVIKVSFLVMLMASLFYAAWVSAATGFGIFTLLIILNCCAFQTFDFYSGEDVASWLYHPFLSYVPRGSAALLVLAAILAYAGRKRWLFVISLLLLIFWHYGFSVINLALLTLALLLSDELFIKAPSEYIGIAAFVLLGVTGIFAPQLSFSVPADSMTTIPSPAFYNHIVSMVLLLALSYAVRPWFAANPDGVYSRFFYGCAAFLIIIDLTAFLFSSPSLIQQMATKLNIPLLAETYSRLAGVRYLLQTSLVVVLLKILWEKLRAGNLNVPPQVYKNLTLATLLIFIFLQLNLRGLFSTNANFFADDCGQVKSRPFSLMLSIQDEPVFFYSLAEYLYEKK